MRLETFLQDTVHQHGSQCVLFFARADLSCIFSSCFAGRRPFMKAGLFSDARIIHLCTIFQLYLSAGHRILHASPSLHPCGINSLRKVKEGVQVLKTDKVHWQPCPGFANGGQLLRSMVLIHFLTIPHRRCLPTAVCPAV